ncbi:MAG: 3-hydroxyacyl-CoA dehydrogenase NAD-binding domain-containing protein, partial [Thermodesulfobacteriota bacterium]
MPKKVEEIKKVAVIGAGTMGSGIAQVLASNKKEVILLDVSDAAITAGIQNIEKSLQRLIKKESITQEDGSSILGNIAKTTKYQDLEQADLVIEAAYEDMAIKKDIYTKLSEITLGDVILATNTSSLPIVEIAMNT